MIYSITIRQTLTRTVEMDAPSRTEAHDAVMAQIENGDIAILNHDDTEINTEIVHIS